LPSTVITKEAVVSPIIGTEGWVATCNELRRKRADQKKRAERLILLPPDYKDDLLQDFNQQLEEDNPEIHFTLQALTRDVDVPSVETVCLESDGDRFIVDPNHSFDSLDSIPDLDLASALLKRSLSISHRVVAPLMLDSMPVPPGWRNSALLRHLRLLVFPAQGAVEIGGYRLTLNPELGLLVEKSS
jgi:hypothetical protein